MVSPIRSALWLAMRFGGRWRSACVRMAKAKADMTATQAARCSSCPTRCHHAFALFWSAKSTGTRLAAASPSVPTTKLSSMRFVTISIYLRFSMNGVDRTRVSNLVTLMLLAPAEHCKSGRKQILDSESSLHPGVRLGVAGALRCAVVRQLLV